MPDPERDTADRAERATGSNALSDEELRLLADCRVRYTLEFVQTVSTTTIEDIADYVTGREAAATDQVYTSRDRDRIVITLHHDVLPRLDDHGFLSFDHEAGRIRDVSVPTNVRTFLDEADD